MTHLSLNSSLGLRREELGGMELEDELMFNLDANLEANDMAKWGPGTPRYRNRRLRFLPCLARAKAYTGEIDDSINDTHLQHDLKRHPSAKA